jgi:hypothetical protein
VLTLDRGIDRLGNARSILTEEAIGRLGQAVTGRLAKWGLCTSDGGRPLAPRPGVRDKGREDG